MGRVIRESGTVAWCMSVQQDCKTAQVVLPSQLFKQCERRRETERAEMPGWDVGELGRTRRIGKVADSYHLIGAYDKPIPIVIVVRAENIVTVRE